MIRVFCDFDGTITTEDMILSFLKEVEPPGYQEVVERIFARLLSQGEGLAELYRKIPSSLYSRLLLHVIGTAEVRAGFEAFVEYCNEREFALSVISGGLEAFVRPIVEPYGVTSVFANHVDTSGEFMQLRTVYTCDEHCESAGNKSIRCSPCKPSIIRQVVDEEDSIFIIGDSVSDLGMAKVARHVFARGYLLRECEHQGLPHTPYETFYDVIEGLEDVTANL
ncbi:MAG: 2-hydroxy-3-keto-5-methylthiopentenyl-phosphate phosphatase [Bacilli bacterium]|nr:2-hydroxy-3-keto-5-methylthiopentenyl-phosphate phosphatase [Bacilli bacterium]